MNYWRWRISARNQGTTRIGVLVVNGMVAMMNEEMGQLNLIRFLEKVSLIFKTPFHHSKATII